MDATDDAVPGPRATAGGPTRSTCTLLNIIRRLSRKGTRMARAQCATIPPEDRAVITRNPRRVRFHLSSACPEQDLFRLVAARPTPLQKKILDHLGVRL